MPADLRLLVRERYPEFAHAYFGVSGATLLLDALIAEGRRTLVLPAFMCPTVSAMAFQTGMNVVHVDVDRQTLQMNREQVGRSLSQLEPQESVLLIDHSFGHPATDVADWKTRFPGLLVIEDCVRALGAEVRGQPVGSAGDWALFSMYKNTIGNDHGAVLLTRVPRSIRSGPERTTTVAEWASGIAPFRAAHQVMKRIRAQRIAAPPVLESPSWTPDVGLPSRLCEVRFARQWRSIVTAREHRSTAGAAIAAELRCLPSVVLLENPADCRDAAFFLSLLLDERIDRDWLIASLHRQGHFLVWAWNTVPAHYSCFSATFPHGAAESLHVAQHIVHIPLWPYVGGRQRRHLVRTLRRCLEAFPGGAVNAPSVTVENS